MEAWQKMQKYQVPKTRKSSRALASTLKLCLVMYFDKVDAKKNGSRAMVKRESGLRWHQLVRIQTSNIINTLKRLYLHDKHPYSALFVEV